MMATAFEDFGSLAFEMQINRKEMSKMNELVFLGKQSVPFTTSEIIAKGTNNQHKNVKELIQKYESDIKDFGTLSVSNGESTGGRPKEIFLLNEEQAVFLMTLLRNSKIVVAFKKELVRQFYAMREYICEHQSPQWQQTRLTSKANRRMETDVIKAFVDYAIAQGSTHADRYYCLFSKLADEAIGIQPKQRDTATIVQLNSLALVETILANTIQACMVQGKPYKDVYQICKARLGEFRKMVQVEFVAIPALPAKKLHQ